jgi:hypothetical protein
MARPQPCRQPQPAAQRVQIHPLVISKSTTSASTATALESCGSRWRRRTEWMRTRCHGTHANSDRSYCITRFTTHALRLRRRFSRHPPSRGSSSKGRIRKPLPALTGPRPHLDPTFLHRRQALPSPVSGTTSPSVRKLLKRSFRALRRVRRSYLMPPEYDSGDEESWPTEEQSRSRWSCSTIATLTAGAKTPSSFDVGETAVSPWFCCVSLAGL